MRLGPFFPALLATLQLTVGLFAAASLSQDASAPMLMLQTSGPVAAFDFSPDGTVLATAGADRIVRLWNARTGELMRQLTGASAPITALTFSPEGHLVVAGWRSGPVVGPEVVWFDGPTWEKHTATQVPFDPARNLTTAQWMRFSEDGKRLLVRHSEGIIVWDASKRAILQRTVEDRAQSVALSSDGKKVALWADKLRVRDAGSGAILGEWSHGDVPPEDPGRPLRKTPDRALAWSPDSTKLAAILADGSAGIRDAATGVVATPLERLKAYVQELTWSPDGKTIAGICSEFTMDYAVAPVSPDAAVAVMWNAETGRIVRRLAINRSLSPVRFVGPDRLLIGKPHQETLLVSTATGVLARLPDGFAQTDLNSGRIALLARQGGLTIRDAHSGKLDAALPSQPSPIRRLALGDDETLVAISEPGIARSWSRRFGRAAPRAVGPSMYDWRDGFTLAPNAASAITRFQDALVHWDTRSGAVRGTIRLEPGERSYQRLAMLPGGILVQGYQHDGKPGETTAVLRLRRLADGVVLQERRWPQRHVRHLSAAPGGSLVCLNLSGSGQGNPEHLLLDPASLETKQTLDETDAYGENLAWAGDGKSFAVVIGAYVTSKDRVRVWSQDPTKPGTWRSTVITGEGPADVAVPNSDGSRIAIGWSDGSLGLWRRSTGAIEPIPATHPGGVAALLWTPDDQRLFSAGQDGRLRTWDIATRKLLTTSVDLGPFAWITWTADEYYVATPDAKNSIKWQVGKELRAAEAFEAERSKPFRVIEALK